MFYYWLEVLPPVVAGPVRRNGEAITWNGVPRAIQREGMRGILPAAIAQRRWKAHTTELVNLGMKRDYSQLARFLQSGSMAAQLGYVDEAVMKEELGTPWMFPDLFRLGASSLLADIERQLSHYVTGHYAAAHHNPLA